MMKTIQIHFSLPTTFVGRVVKWWTGDQFSHSWIVLDGIEYNPIPPKLQRNISVESGDLVIEFEVTEDQFNQTKDWCEALVGSFYDFLGILGWILRIKSLDDPKKMYCHEFSHEVFVKLGYLNKKDRLIHAEHLIVELLFMGCKVVKGKYVGLVKK